MQECLFRHKFIKNVLVILLISGYSINQIEGSRVDVCEIAPIVKDDTVCYFVSGIILGQIESDHQGCSDVDEKPEQNVESTLFEYITLSLDE